MNKGTFILIIDIWQVKVNHSNPYRKQKTSVKSTKVALFCRIKFLSLTRFFKYKISLTIFSVPEISATLHSFAIA